MYERSTILSERKAEAFGDREVMREDTVEDAASQAPGCTIGEAVSTRCVCLDLKMQGRRGTHGEGTEGAGTSPWG